MCQNQTQIDRTFSHSEVDVYSSGRQRVPSHLGTADFATLAHLNPALGEVQPGTW